jgi:hypothetical protein
MIHENYSSSERPRLVFNAAARAMTPALPILLLESLHGGENHQSCVRGESRKVSSYASTVRVKLTLRELAMTDAPSSPKSHSRRLPKEKIEEKRREEMHTRARSEWCWISMNLQGQWHHGNQFYCSTDYERGDVGKFIEVLHKHE